MSNITAQLIATLMVSNADALNAGTKSRAEYQAEQDRLWALAAERHISKMVARLVIRRVA